MKELRLIHRHDIHKYDLGSIERPFFAVGTVDLALKDHKYISGLDDLIHDHSLDLSASRFEHHRSQILQSVSGVSGSW
ncbi:hypothetical protein [Pseudomonas sp. NA-150]|uniref:hypothetical protein n=1 Tax=Pseudomonas sp. NA-150 TaxID=3367525 RepID=UPI0037C88527